MNPISDEELSQASLAVNRLLQKVLFTAREFLNMEVAFIAEFTEGHRVFKLIDAKPDMENLLSVDAGDPLEDSYCQRVVDGRLPGLMQNAQDYAEACTLPVTQALPVGAHLSVPIYLEDGTVYGTFCCFSRQPDYSLTERDLNIMKAYGKLASALLDHFIAEDLQRLNNRRVITDIIKHQRFYTVYQGIYQLQDLSVMGYEALTRFDVPLAISTQDWFVEAEKAGLASHLETAVATMALDGMSFLLPQQYMTINLSPHAILEATSLAPLFGTNLSRVVVEITEHQHIEDYTAIADILAPLRHQGLKLAVDDAGAGYASLSHILQLKPDIIKLDRCLIHDLDKDADEYALASALVAFANTTGAQIIAEGVETEGELAALKGLGITHAQGYLLARPEPLVSH